MDFRNFRLNILFRVIVLVAAAFVLVWGVLKTNWQITPFVCALLLGLCVAEFIHYVEKTNRELTEFLDFISHNDFSVSVPIEGKGRIFTELERAYRLLTGKYRQLNLQKAANHQYLESVVEHVSVALVCFDDADRMSLMNRQAKTLFRMPHLNNMQSFSRLDPALPALLRSLASDERALIAVRIEDEPLQLVLFATEFVLLDRRYKLVSFQNIRDELDQREIDSWQKLIRVLTHEIMNSVTPIISLSKVLRETLVDESAGGPTLKTLTPQGRDDMLRSVTSIHTRSSGLLTFVQAYRSLTNLPAPVFSRIDLQPLLEHVRTLLSQELDNRGIRLEIECESAELIVRADPHQIEQVLINLIKNAIEALADRPAPMIGLRILRDDQGKVLLQMIDNGPGIDPAHLDSIFVPFFTTKRNGTGVGLSISRQIMFANKGTIAVKSVPGEGCVFTLKFG